MQRQKWSQIVIALVYIALGVVFIIYPEGVESLLCIIMAAAIGLIGILYLLGYFILKTPDEGRRDPRGFVVGILLIALAVFIIVRQDMVMLAIPYIFGLMLVIRGLLTVRAAFYIRSLGGGFWKVFIAGLIPIGLGVFIAMFPFETMRLFFIFVGIGLVVGGIVSLIEEIIARGAARRREHELERLRDMQKAEKARKGEGDLGEDGEIEVVEAEIVERGMPSEAAEPVEAPVEEAKPEVPVEEPVVAEPKPETSAEQPKQPAPAKKAEQPAPEKKPASDEAPADKE